MLIKSDGFGKYATSLTALQKSWQIPSTQGIALTANGGRFGGPGVEFTPASGSFDKAQYLQCSFSGESELIVLLAIKQNATQFEYGGRLLTFLDGSTTQLGVNILPSGQLRIVQAANAGSGVFLHPTEGSEQTILGDSTNAISASDAQFLQVKVVFHSSAGSIVFKRGNGSTLYSLTGINSAKSGNPNCASLLVGGYVVFGASSKNLSLQGTVSNFALLNTAGAFLNDYPNDVRVETKMPTGAGNYAEWSPDPDANWENVDETPPDDDSSKNSTATVGARDSFTTDDSDSEDDGTVFAVVHNIYCKKDSGGTNGVSGLLRLSGVDANGTEVDVPDDWAYGQSVSYEKPGGGAMTVADFNAAEKGYELTT